MAEQGKERFLNHFFAIIGAQSGGEHISQQRSAHLIVQVDDFVLTRRGSGGLMRRKLGDSFHTIRQRP